jgi:2,4-diaminopentanoate dehydrogenase
VLTSAIKRDRTAAANSYRVVVWATGGIGSIAIRAIQRRPDIELVSVWVHSQEKVGKVAAEPGLLSSVDLPRTIPRNAFVTQ